MLIWILALVLFAIAGFSGYRLGAVRFAVSFLGLLLAAALAMPLAPAIRPLVNMIGFKNPIWPVVLPAVIAFVLVYAIFIGVSFVVHRKVELYFKYKADDASRIGWERVNQAAGLWLGLATGAVWLGLFGLVIYVVGYLAVQVATDDTSSTPVKLLAEARQELHSTSLDRAVAPFDPMPPRYYEGSDIIGLIYQNPILVSRLSQYPPFLLMGEKPEIQELAKDAEFNQALLSKGDALELFKNPKLQAIIQNPDDVQELLGQDFKDFRTYLETGISPKYEEERILGKWKLDPYATMAQERKKRPDMTSTEMRRLKAVMTEVMPGISLTATTDKKITVKADGIAERLKQLFNPTPAPQAAAAPQDGQPNISPSMLQRYGPNYGRNPQRQRAVAPAIAATPKTNDVPYVVLSAQGSWDREGDKYQLKVQDEKGKSETLPATADEERLTVMMPTVTLVFAKAD